MLVCHECNAESRDSAWHWIMVIVEAPGGNKPDANAYCPVCAESRFGYFTHRRLRRATINDYDAE